MPLGISKPWDIAGLATFLSSEYLSGWVVGSQVLVDGGMYVDLQYGCSIDLGS